MNLERYSYFTNNYSDYLFYSIGPKGKIAKVISFVEIPGMDVRTYNLALTDYNELTGIHDDTSVTNNGDRDKVLATVARAVLDFCEHYGNPDIFAEGSDAEGRRTNLYQRCISSRLPEITVYFDVYGIKTDLSKEAFQKNGVYRAFLIKRKKIVSSSLY